MGKIAFIFPGQGSQTVGMGKDLADRYPEVKSVFDSLDDALGNSLTSLIFEGPQEKLTLTVNAQPALLATSIAILEKVKQYNIKPDFVAGHSLGEYTALVTAGVLEFKDAVKIVQKRGEFMEQAVPNGQGTMAAILGMERDVLNQLTEKVTEAGDSVQLANLNCPGQIVISGTRAGVEKACQLAKENGAKRAIPLEVSGPFHSRLMEPASEKLASLFEEFTFNSASVPVISNVTADAVTDGEEMKKLLVKQLYSPVLWEDSIQTMIKLGVDTFVEIGPGKVLTGLVRKIDRTLGVLSIYDEASLLAAIEQLKEVKE